MYYLYVCVCYITQYIIFNRLYIILHMNLFLGTILFIIVFLIYIHITNQYKTSEDMEIYEMDYKSNIILQETCDIRQPIVFEIPSLNIPDFTVLTEKFPRFVIHVKDLEDYVSELDTVETVQLPVSSMVELLKNDNNGRYIIENNNEFLEESKLKKIISKLDEILSPSSTVFSHYDFLGGSNGACTPFRYHTYTRKYLVVCEGAKIRVKMAPWGATKYLHKVSDYDAFEFRSPINVWNVQEKYTHDMDKIQILDFEVSSSNVLYIPPYWWYSIQYDGVTSGIIEYTYGTFVNRVAYINDIGRHWLQQQNILSKVTKTLSLESNTNQEIQDVQEDVQEDI